MEKNTGNNSRSKLRELDNSTYSYLKMYLTSMTFLWCALKSAKNFWLALQHIQIPHPVFSLVMWECSSQLNSTSELSPVFFPKNQTTAPNLIQTGATMLQMQLHEFKLPKNKECIVTFLNFFYTAWSYVYYCLKNRKY